MQDGRRSQSFFALRAGVVRRQDLLDVPETCLLRSGEGTLRGGYGASERNRPAPGPSRRA